VTKYVDSMANFKDSNLSDTIALRTK